MERTKKRVEKVDGVEPKLGQLLFQKIGGGSLRIKLDGKDRIIKPGQKFFAREEEIPVAFRDTIECVSDAQEISEAKKAEEIKTLTKTVLRIVLSEVEENTSIKEQIQELDEVDFEDEGEVESLKTGLIENGYPELAELEAELIKDAVVEKLKSQYVYDIVNKKGKKLNELPLAYEEAEKLVETLS